MLRYISSGITGLGLFLLGMKLLTTGLSNATDSSFRHQLRKMKLHPLIGVMVGTIATMLLQSSSGMTVIIVGLVDAKLLTLYQATPLIMGANIGTTITAQLIAFKIGAIAPFILVLGLVLSFINGKKKVSFIGEVLVGFSLIFKGMDLLSAGVSPLEDSKRFQEVLAIFGVRPLFGIVLGFLTTAIIQSSSTGIAILQSLTKSNALSINSALPILLGQNIGTCITTLVAGVNASCAGKRAALIHLLFNTMGVLLFFPFINILSELVVQLAPFNPARQLAHAHSLFNIISTILFLPFIDLFVKAAELSIKRE